MKKLLTWDHFRTNAGRNLPQYSRTDIGGFGNRETVDPTLKAAGYHETRDERGNWDNTARSMAEELLRRLDFPVELPAIYHKWGRRDGAFGVSLYYKPIEASAV